MPLPACRSEARLNHIYYSDTDQWLSTWQRWCQCLANKSINGVASSVSRHKLFSSQRHPDWLWGPPRDISTGTSGVVTERNEGKKLNNEAGWCSSNILRLQPGGFRLEFRSFTGYSSWGPSWNPSVSPSDCLKIIQDCLIWNPYLITINHHIFSPFNTT